MESNWQTIVVYLVVGITIGLFLRGLFSGYRKPSKACGCDDIKRPKVIEDYLKHQQRRKPPQ